MHRGCVSFNKSIYDTVAWDQMFAGDVDVNDDLVDVEVLDAGFDW